MGNANADRHETIPSRREFADDVLVESLEVRVPEFEVVQVGNGRSMKRNTQPNHKLVKINCHTKFQSFALARTMSAMSVVIPLDG